MGELVIAQKLFINANFGGALIPDRRNVFGLHPRPDRRCLPHGAAQSFPLTSRMRFEAIQNLRLEWDLDYDPGPAGSAPTTSMPDTAGADTTVGIVRTLLNAVDEKGSTASPSRASRSSPSWRSADQTRTGFNLAANGGYDFVHGALQYAGVQTVYNWNCCGLTSVTGVLLWDRFATKPNTCIALPWPTSAP